MSTSAISPSSSSPPLPIPPSLLQVVASRDLPQLKAILGAPGTDINVRDKWGRTPLHTAISINWPEGSRVLIEAGADLEARCDEGLTPLHETIFFSQTLIFDLLLEKGVNIEALDTKRRSPLLHAAQSLHPHLAEALLHAGANISALDHENHSPLWHAILHNNRATIALLLAYGASCDDILGNTFFHLCDVTIRSRFGIDGLTEILLKAIAVNTPDELSRPISRLVNKPNRAGETPIRQAYLFLGNSRSFAARASIQNFIEALHLAGALLFSQEVATPPQSSQGTRMNPPF